MPPRTRVITEPAHSMMYNPASLRATRQVPDFELLLGEMLRVFRHPLNPKQDEAFRKAFTDRVSLLWGPPGTGKSSVVEAVIAAWVEVACQGGRGAAICVGSSNYNAIDNVLLEVAELLARRRQNLGEFPIPVRLVRFRSDSKAPLVDDRIEDVVASSRVESDDLATSLNAHEEILIVGGTWQQLGKLAKRHSADQRPSARWFDLMLIDEASQVPVSAAVAYFLLSKEDGHVLLAGDQRLFQILCKRQDDWVGRTLRFSLYRPLVSR